MIEAVEIVVARDFSTHPLGRQKDIFPFSGERFREEFLEAPLKEGRSVRVDLRGTRGLAPSFLEEAFGGLIDAGLSWSTLAHHLTYVADDTATESRITQYIRRAAGLSPTT